ncbi:MAG: class I SAM-dependent methyltransferase [Planctomycetes bacterium]|nr:class I SAM-dependent methyltransferase [Planctomycetota bacterium]
MKTAIQLVEKGLVPSPLIRRGIRGLLGQRLEEQRRIWDASPDQAMEAWTESMRTSPIALVPEKANEQHYELPAEFFELVLGPHRKYSSAFYPRAGMSLAEAEEAMLRLTCERARLVDGQRILELGCGWGSLTLWMARNYPQSSIVAVSNSAPQRRSIEARLEREGLTNVQVITADMNSFEAPGTFDRIVSVEMFEHMRNWEELLGKARNWIRDDGFLFMHVFAHTRYAYPFEEVEEDDWMSRYFFSGGMMPQHAMLDRLRIPFEVAERWEVSGTHYARTSEDWTRNLERRKREILPILAETYGAGQAKLWFHRWRVFFLSCAELFAWDKGREWIVSHQLLSPSAGDKA